jgi:acylphosphatase
MVRRRILVHGQVQGVFFRDSVRERAQSRGLAGWVRNRDDGAVEAVFEGVEEDVDALVRFCHEGPGRADVERVEVADEDPLGDEGFAVR